MHVHTVRDKILEGENFGDLTPDIIWWITFWRMLTFKNNNGCPMRPNQNY